MKKYILLIGSFLFLFTSYAQIDTFELINSNLFLKKSPSDRYLIIDRGSMEEPNFANIYLTIGGKITCKLISTNPKKLDTLYQYRYDTLTERVLSKTIFIGNQGNDKEITYNATKEYYNKNDEVYKIEKCKIEALPNSASKYRLEEVNINIFNKRGKVIGVEKKLENKLIKKSFIDLVFKESVLFFYVTNNKDTLIKNGNGVLSAPNYDLSWYNMSFEDSFYVKGKLIDGILDGEWVAKRIDGTIYFKEKYENGKFISGVSYDKNGQEYNYETIMIDCLFGSCQKDLTDYIRKNINYPYFEKENEIQGRTFTKFIIDKEGYVTDVTSLTQISTGLEKESKRVVQSMDKWTPAILRGQKVAVSYVLPINYQLE